MVAKGLNSWTTIVITSPEEKACESRIIVQLLESGAADIVHIRKPGWTREAVGRLIAQIPATLHPCLRLHDQFELLHQFPNLGGVHLNARQISAPVSAQPLSRSMHTAQELATAGRYDYVTISPIYDSISKPGYNSALSEEIINGARQCGNAIALGGVTPQRMPFLASAGFAGAALLGYIWECSQEEQEMRINVLRRYTLMLKNFRLQFITDANDVATAVSQSEDAIEGGCRWIQIRMKDASDDSVREVAKLLRPKCCEKSVTLLVDDRVDIAVECDVDGVHLGKNDMSPAEARKFLGSGKIIGSTANSFEDIEEIVGHGASDYIGLGPFRFTKTKRRLAPVLGVEGYASIFSRMDAAMQYIPVVAIGGITADDIDEVIRTGANGIAVSGAICHSGNPVESARKMIDILDNIANK